MNDPSAPFLKPLVRSLSNAMRRAPIWSVGLSLALCALGFVIYINTDGAVKLVESMAGVNTLKAAHEHCEHKLTALESTVEGMRKEMAILKAKQTASVP